MRFTYTGKELKVGDVDPSITFTNLKYDWAGNGYTLKLEVTPQDGSPIEHELVAVVGHPTWAKLESVDGVFLSAVEHSLSIIAYKSGERKIVDGPYVLPITEA